MKLTPKRVILGVILVTAAGTGAAYMTGVIAKPSAGLIDKGDWVTGEDIQVKSSAYVHNPNPLGLNLTNFSADYKLLMNNVKLAEGEKEGLRIPKNTNRTIRFTTDLQTGNIPRWWATHLENSEESRLEIPITAGLKLGPVPLSFSGYSYTDTISTDIEGSLSTAVSRMEGNYSRTMGPETGLEANDFRIQVEDASARFGSVSTGTTELVMPITLKNPNDYTVPTPQLGGSLELNDVRIANFTANNIRTARDTNIPPGGTREITVTAEMSNARIDNWFKTHVRKSEKTDAVLNIYMEFEVAGTSFKVPSDDGMDCRFSFTTGILVDEKAESEGFKQCSGIETGPEGGSDDDRGDGSLLDGSSGSGGSDSSNSTENSTDGSDGGLGGLL